MRPLIASILISLDGFIDGPNAEFVPPVEWCDGLDRMSRDILQEADTLLYGRKSFEMNAAFWSPAETDPDSPAAQLDFAGVMNSLPKLVMSNTLPDNPGWNGRTLRGDVAAEIAALKALPGKAIVTFGGAGAVETLMRHDLIDEYRLMLNPIVLGGGNPLFKGGYDRFQLKLLEARPLASGVVILRYRPRNRGDVAA